MLIMSINISYLFAQPVSNDKNLKEISDKVDILSDEIEKQKSDKSLYIPVSEKGAHGLAPAASKVYQIKKGLAIGGYGELVAQIYQRKNQKGDTIERASKPNTIDLQRAVFYFGYKFNDNFVLNSEIEFEHSGAEINVEFLYLDFLYKEWLNFRAGKILVPVGLINEYHEPTTFQGTFRPLTERFILPATWGEIGAGFFGKYNFFSYKAYAVTSLDATKYSATTGIRNGRLNADRALAHDIAGVVRADFDFDIISFGLSSFLGNTGQISHIPSLMSLSDIHSEIKWKGLYLRNVIAFSLVNDADKINERNKFKGDKSIGEQLLGGYAELGYNVLNLVNTRQAFILFGRYEFLDTQFKVPSGYAKNGANEQHILTFGFSYKPILNIVLKTDYQFYFNKSRTGIDQLNLGLGYIF